VRNKSNTPSLSGV